MLRYGVVLFAALVMGCHDSTAPASINGTYPLRTYREQRLPGMVSETSDQSLQITGGSITLNGDLTFHSSYSFDKYSYGNFTKVTVECDGNWSPTETSPQGGQLITLDQTLNQACYDHAIAEWDHHNHLTIVWTYLGGTQHAR